MQESESIQNQKSLLIQYAIERDWEIYQIYCDEDYSGIDRNRPDFNRMLQDAQAHRFNVILCKTQSRFTRDMELVEKYIHGKFLLWGIRFIAIADHVDTEIRGSKKARQINGLINEWYLEDLSENIRMVLDHKRREGLYVGGFPLYGYQKHPTEKGRLIIDEEAAIVVRQIFQWALEGKGKQQIANLLNQQGLPNPSQYKKEHGLGYVNGSTKNEYGLWNRTSVWRILNNEMYLGTMVQGVHRKLSYKSNKLIEVPREEWFRVAGTHAAIIDADTFYSVQNVRKLRSKTDGTGIIHPLSGLVKCMDCGSTMSKSSNTRHTYLRCKLSATSGKLGLCTRHSIRLDKLLSLVEDKVRTYVSDFFSLEIADQRIACTQGQETKAVLQRERTTIDADLEKHTAALKSLYLDKVSGLISKEQFQSLNDSFLQEQNNLAKRKKRVTQQLSNLESEAASQNHTLQRATEILKLNPVPRDLLILLIEKIEVGERNKESGKQKLHIHWKI